MIWYGPHPCRTCGKTIARQAEVDGAAAFDYPTDGPIYPTTPWVRHVCLPDPPAPPAPEVVVSEEVTGVWVREVYGPTATYTKPEQNPELCSHLRKVFPLLLRDNPWAVDQAIRERVAKAGMKVMLTGWQSPDDSLAAHHRALLTALGVTP